MVGGGGVKTHPSPGYFWFQSQYERERKAHEVSQAHYLNVKQMNSSIGKTIQDNINGTKLTKLSCPLVEFLSGK